jgi:multiple sugar transport system substrate-binding protein
MLRRTLKTLLLGTCVGLAPIALSNALAQTAAERAVEAAKAYAGQTLTVTWEAGLQALEPLNYSIPKWEEATGVNVEVIEVPINEMFTKTLVEHRAGTGAYDVLNVVPAWMPDLAAGGALAPLDEYIEKYGYAEDLADIGATYRENQMTYNGKVYGLPDDGDALLLFYRQDLFSDATHQAAFKAANGYDLAPPATWNQFYDIAKYFDGVLGEGNKAAGGAAMIHAPGLVHFLYTMRFRTAGGTFFDPETMAAKINGDTGVAVLADMVRQLDNMPSGASSWGPIEVLNAWMGGDLAMTIWWPPAGRWSEGYGADEDVLSWLPKTEIAGKVGYALPPEGHTQLAAGWLLSVSSDSDNPELAYLFTQWMNSSEVSLGRVTLPYALRDPFRNSHFTSEEYRGLWPNAGQYLDALQDASGRGLLDLSIIDTFSYEEALGRAIISALSGSDPKTALDQAAAEWDALTQEIGIEEQKAAYLDWSSKPGAYPN